MAKVVSYKENTDKQGLEQDVSIQDFDFQKLAGMLDVTDVDWVTFSHWKQQEATS